MSKSLDDVIDDLRCGWGQYVLVLLSGELVAGLVKMVMSLGVHDYVSLLGFTAFERAWVFSAVFVGNSIGNFFAGYVGDTFGRKVAILMGSLVTTCGMAPLPLGATSFLVFTVSNSISGLGIGLMGPACWTLIAEVSPVADRAYLNGMGHLVWQLGAILGLVPMCLGASPYMLLHASFLFCCLHTFAVLCFVHESPVHLARRGDLHGAMEVLETIHRRNGGDRGYLCNCWKVVEPPTDKVSYVALASDWRALMITLACGIIVMTCNYCQYGLFYMLPMLVPHADSQTALLSVLLSCVADYIAMVCAHAISRRHLMAYSVMAAGIGTVGVLLVHHKVKVEIEVAVICVPMALISVVFFIAYLYIVEVSGAALRASCTGFAMMAGRAAATAAPLLRESLGTQTFIMSMVVADLVSVVIICCLRVEPNMRQLGEISAERRALVPSANDGLVSKYQKAIP
eukprot:TRINITY_DN29783_c0_g1_i1.p1 TRINITY_DN29783_c0_g1~~TRINITY_DN29783_c0_g1_i1.p1  ORF type:complete len:456 (-),score=73.62 TRINITY_DN29783_c0_g1_i1:80-1447(-)